MSSTLMSSTAAVVCRSRLASLEPRDQTRSPSWLVLSLVVLAGLHPALVHAETRPAVPILSPKVITPLAASGLGLAPEVMAEIAIDARGRVTGVEVLKIEPSTELDDEYRTAVEGTLAGWRFAPAQADGEPVASTQRLNLQFTAYEGSGAPLDRRATGSTTLGLVAVDDQALAPTRIFRMPLEVQRQRLEELAATAERHLDPAFRRRSETARFVVISDTPTPEMGQALANNLEAAFEALDALLGPHFELQPQPYKIVVYLYRERAALLALWREIGATEQAAGIYRPPGFIAGYGGQASEEWLVHLLVHEASHAYVDRHLRRPGAGFPFWLGEGFAEYVSSSKIKQGQLLPGAELGSRFAIGNGLTARQEKSTGEALKRVKRVVKEGQLGLSEILAVDISCFQGEQAEAYYGLSWLFVHFLRHGEQSWAEREFPRLMLYAAEGYPALDAIEAVYGMTPSELEPAFEDYVRGL